MGWRNICLEALDDLEKRAANLRDELEAPERRRERPSPDVVASFAIRAALEAVTCAGTALEESSAAPRSLADALGAAHSQLNTCELATSTRAGAELEQRARLKRRQLFDPVPGAGAGVRTCQKCGRPEFEHTWHCDVCGASMRTDAKGLPRVGSCSSLHAPRGAELRCRDLP